ncbi:hypothetical protein LZ31DRAFT_84706 [Colletotrichum somersetense]|nr:hypothetical protein LZ31DRAFT_84706 [Colletotrichum somersetense]
MSSITPKLCQTPPMRSLDQLNAKPNRHAHRHCPPGHSEWWKISWKIHPPSWYSLRLDFMGAQRDTLERIAGPGSDKAWSQGFPDGEACRVASSPHILLTHQRIPMILSYGNLPTLGGGRLLIVLTVRGPRLLHLGKASLSDRQGKKTPTWIRNISGRPSHAPL